VPLEKDGELGGSSIEGLRRGEGRLAKPMVVSTRHREAEDELTMKGSRRWCLAPLEASEEEGRRAGERRLRCGTLHGWRCPFIGASRGVHAAGIGG
jgi:hypothetical protein